MANLRLSILTYEDHPLAFGTGPGMSIGQAVDEHIRHAVDDNKRVMELSLFFSDEEQPDLRAAYGGVELDSMGNPLDGGPMPGEYVAKAIKMKNAKKAY